MLSILLHHIRFLNNNHFGVVNEHANRGSSHCIRYINFVIDTSTGAYFKDNFSQFNPVDSENVIHFDQLHQVFE